MNEIMVAFTTFWMVLYSGIVDSKDVAFYFGKIESIIIIIYCLINLQIIIASTVINNKKIIVYGYNLMNHKFNQL